MALMLRVEHNGTPLLVESLSVQQLIRLAGPRAVLAADSSFLLSLVESDSLSLTETKRVFERFADRLVIPATVSTEVRRLGTAKVEEAVRRSAKGIKYNVRSAPRGLSKRDVASIESEFAAIKARYEATWKDAATARLQDVLAIVDARTQPALVAAEYEEIARTAPFRYTRSIPPGFADATKPEELRFNDLKIWFELITIARARRAPIFFVTNERKEDWWKMRGKDLEATHPDLVREMFAQSGQRFALVFGPTLVPQYESASRTASYLWPTLQPSALFAQAFSLESLADKFTIRVPAFERLQETLGLAFAPLDIDLFRKADLGIASLGKVISGLENTINTALGSNSLLARAGIWLGRDFNSLEGRNEDLWKTITGASSSPSILSALGIHGGYLKETPSWLELQGLQSLIGPSPSVRAELAQSSLAFSTGKNLEHFLGTFGVSPTNQFQQLYDSIRQNQATIERLRALWGAMDVAPLRVDPRIQRLVDLSVAAESDSDRPRRVAARVRRRRSAERRRLRRQLRGYGVNLYRRDSPIYLGS